MKEDIRVTKSKNELKKALMNILATKEKDLEEITVFEICEVAKVNKMTFYNHYGDKYELFRDVVQNMASQTYNEVFNKKFEVSFPTDPINYSVKLLSEILNKIIEHKNIFLKLAENTGSLYSFILSEVIEESLTSIFVKVEKLFKPKYPIKFIAGFFTAGVVKIILIYLKDENISKENIMTNLEKFITDIIKYNIIFEH